MINLGTQIATILFVIILIPFAIKFFQASGRKEVYGCTKCGYVSEGEKEKCPECGTKPALWKKQIGYTRSKVM